MVSVNCHSDDGQWGTSYL
uniref:Uncharacterized protein n=1 Tax=Anguilla anguilla TaxID=7936 RepID=A0A0E9T1Y4_ANGAN